MLKHLTPREGLNVPMLGGGYLPPEGKHVEWSAYYARLVMAGDAIDTTDEADGRETRASVAVEPPVTEAPAVDAARTTTRKGGAAK